MKILIIITKGEVGGAQVSVLNLAKKLKEKGNEVSIGMGDGDFLAKELAKSSIAFYRFKWLKRTYNPFANLFFIFELKKYLNNHNNDVVHFNSSNALFGAIGAKLSYYKPVTVFTFRGMSLLDDNYETLKIIKIIYLNVFKFLLKFIDKPVFVSKKNLATAKELKIDARGTVIYNGRDPEDMKFLAKEQARDELGKIIGINLENNFIIGTIGRLAYPKNYEFLIRNFGEILKINNSARLIIIGEGPERQKYHDLIEEFKREEYIFLSGEIKNAYRYITGFDLFVLPSIFEGLSITLIETLFSGVPILTTKVGGSPELLNNSEDQLYELNNEHDFIAKFKKLATDQNLYNTVSNQNKNQATNFNINKTAEEYLRIYN